MDKQKPLSNVILPQPRTIRVEAKDVSRRDPVIGSVVTKRAQDRTLDAFERNMMPSDVKSYLENSITGDMQQQTLLFYAMLDTWPRLQKAIGELADNVAELNWTVTPATDREGNSTPKAQEKADFVEQCLYSMKPSTVKAENGLTNTIKNLVFSYFLGHGVQEILWMRDKDGIKPVSTKDLPPRYFAYPYINNEEDRLMFNRSGLAWSSNLEDFEEHKFLIGINQGHPGQPTTSAPLRALTGYWIGAVYGLKWLLNHAQLFGIPFRWATYSNEEGAKAAVCNMLENIGSAGWGAFPKGTELQFIDAGKAASALPQRELIDLADKQCDTFILGQTLTTDVGDSGSRALGDVHETVREDRVRAIAKYVGNILTNQLSRSIIAVNWADDEDIPDICADIPEAKDEQGMANRDKVLMETFPSLKWSEKQIRARHGIDMPEDEADTFSAKADGMRGDPATGGVVTPHETKPSAELDEQEEEEDAAKVESKNAPDVVSVDSLAESVLEGLTGVSVEWLAPVKPIFSRLAALAMSNTVTDVDFWAALDKAKTELPELFDVLDTEALETAFRQSIATAMVGGSAERYI